MNGFLEAGYKIIHVLLLDQTSVDETPMIEVLAVDSARLLSRLGTPPHFLDGDPLLRFQ